MVEAGGFDEDDRIELLDGEIWELSPPGTRHVTAVLLAQEALRSALPDYQVRRESPFALDEMSQPQPDLSVVRGAIRDYADAHPNRSLLLVEVADSSLAHDRRRKLAAYARNDIPEYWIIDLTASRLEVYREPSGAEFLSKSVFGPGESVLPLCAPEAVIAIDNLLP